MRIYYCAPFSLERNLGREYNEYVKKLTQHEDDWVFFLDGDVLFLDSNWGNHVNDLIQKYPNTGIFTCYTNRVGNIQQCYNGIRSDDPDILNHYQIAQKLKQEKYWNVKKHNNRVISGYMFGFSRRTWEEVGGFSENKNEILKVDNRFSKKVLQLGKDILVMEGLYVFHYYRMNEQDPKHANQHLL
jgi:GT2 family glycosyltransferase